MNFDYRNLTPEQFDYAANCYEYLAGTLDGAGLPWLGQFGHIAAAEIDFRNEGNKRWWGGAFNGQQGRTEIIENVIKICQISDVVETGTFRGTTSEFLATRVSGRIYSCELATRYFLYAQRRLCAYSNVEIQLADSRTFLESLLGREAVRQSRVLFYLDAHWNADLPLAREIEIILTSHPSNIIAIDDFQVPFDNGYGYDDYGADKRLWLPILAPFRDRISNFYVPAIASQDETGAKRGCIFFASTPELDNLLAQVPNLRRIEERDWSSCLA